MPRFSLERMVNAEIDKVFDAATDFAGLERAMPQYFRSVRVLSTRGDVTIVEEHLVLAKRELVMTTKHIVDRPHAHHTFVIGGDAKGSHIREGYSGIGEMTRMEVEADMRMGPVLGMRWLLGSRDILRDFEGILDGFAALAEI